jgi:hypothetical protein
MGTSQSHNSPRSASWDEVRKLYAQGADAARVAGAIARAVPEASVRAITRPQLCCLDATVEQVVKSAPERATSVLVAALDEADEVGHDLPASLARAAALRTAQLIGEADIAGQPRMAARAYAAEYMAAFFEYFVERDIHDYIGGEAFPTVGAATAFAEAVALEARRAVMAHLASMAAEEIAHAAGAQLVSGLMLGALGRLRGMSSLGS